MLKQHMFGGFFMFVVKKNIVLARTDGGAPGLIKLEYFGGRTTGEVKTHCPEGAIAELMVDGRYFSAPAASKFNLPYPLTRESKVAARIVKGGAVIALSSPAPVFGEEEIFKSNQEPGGQEEEPSDMAQPAENAEQAPEEQSFSEEAPSAEKEDIAAVVQTAEKTAEEDKGEQSVSVAQTKPAGRKGKSKCRGGKSGFLDGIKENLDELFATYPKQEKLAGIVPNSVWVSVPAEGGGYVVGIIADEDGRARYLCYGIPDKDNTAPPTVRPECRGWLPVEEEGAGYWVMYQDINSGEIVTHT